MHRHGGSGPAVRDISHPGQVHVHDAGVQSSLAVVGDLVTRGVIVVETGGHGSYVLRREIIKEGPEIFRRSGKTQISSLYCFVGSEIKGNIKLLLILIIKRRYQLDN